ncbi:hypothetical protein PROFUN_03376 [Planoprotostelium fungivorum]|uniref:Uncharacterized protein n=1 Tax=Planoprotostelium fungivorum TaxID=1890364 RepID=A0A2P6NWC2_9EUKA|nr:hypothetical protein PROFUN_03376 [Planoprotostelium fungivorum]
MLPALTSSEGTCLPSNTARKLMPTTDRDLTATWKYTLHTLYHSGTGLFEFCLILRRDFFHTSSVYDRSDDSDMTSYVDTHCNIPNILTKLNLLGNSNGTTTQTEIIEAFAKMKQDVIKDKKLEAIVSVASDSESQLDTMHLIDNVSEAFGVFGIHPLYAQQMTEEVVERMESYMKHPKTVAWGEIGLDYHPFPGYNYAAPDLQKETFIRQMSLAIKHEKPIVIHTREAEADTLDLMKKHLPRDWPLHVHCFTDSPQFARDLIAEFDNLFIGFTGVITFKNSTDLRKVVEVVPLDRLLLETDGPFMAPIPHRGKVCHPGHVPFIADQIAKTKQVPVDLVYSTCRANTKRMYRL